LPPFAQEMGTLLDFFDLYTLSHLGVPGVFGTIFHRSVRFLDPCFYE